MNTETASSLSGIESSAGVAGPARAPASVLDGWPRARLFAALFLLGALPYLNTLLNGFVYDDHSQVVANPYLQSFRYLKEIFSTNVWSFVGHYGVTNYYRPVMTIGYLLCYQWFGPLPYGFHLANVAVHTAAVTALFFTAERMFRDRRVAFAAALAFAFHPVHTESVAWIAAVTDVEVTFFFLLTFWFYLGTARPHGASSAKVQAGMGAAFLLALMSKEQAFVLPALATVYEHFYRDDRRETSFAQKFRRYILLWILGLAYFVFRVRFFGGLAPVLQRPQVTWTETLLSAVALVGQYVGKLFWPAELCAFYVFHKSGSLGDAGVLGGVAALALSGALFLWLWKRRRTASFSILWLFATLAPVLNARWMAANVFGERYLYLPSAGFCWLVGWGFVEAWTRASKRGPAWRTAVAALAAVVAAVGLARTVFRNRDWKNDTVLYTKTLAVSPDAYMIRNNLGTVFWMGGDVEAAEREWAQALRIAPDSTVILNNLGMVYARRKQYAQAIDYFDRALKAKPDFTDSYINLGSAYEDMGKKELAEREFRKAVELSPLNFRARNKLGALLLGEGRTREAEEQYAASAGSAPTVEALDALGDIFLARGERERAERAFRQATEIDTFDSHARFKLGDLLAAAGRDSQALEQYEAGLKSDPNNAEALRAIERLKSNAPQNPRTRP